MEKDSIMKSSSSSLVPLSQAKMTAIQNWRERPKQYYATLHTTTPRKMIEAETPTLWELRSQLGHPAAIAILVNAFIHAAKLVNLDKNLTTEQIGEAANDTLEQYGQLKVEEIKFLLKRALQTQNVYGRLDYNVLMNWIEQYDNERTEEAMRISEQKESQERNNIPSSHGAMSYQQWLEGLKERAKTDKAAKSLFDDATGPGGIQFKALEHEDRTNKEIEFKKYFHHRYKK